MENFFYNYEFYRDLDNLIDSLTEEVQDLPNDWEIECNGSILEPIITLCSDWIVERIDDDRFSEDNVDSEYEKIKSAISKNINFDFVNSLIPEVYYMDRNVKFKITKKDLLEWVK